MTALIPYIMQMIQNGGTALVPSGSRAVTAPGTSLVPYSPNIIDGEWSEVPRGIGGQSQPRLGYIHNSEVQPPPRETFQKPAPRMGPLIDGEVVRGIGEASRGGLAAAGASGGSLASMANPLLAAVMGALQGDVLNKHQPRMYASAAPASPQGRVNSAPLPDIPSANDVVAARFGGMAPSSMTPNDQVASRFGSMQPPSQMTPNQYVAQNFPPVMAQSVPMPRARPAQANAPLDIRPPVQQAPAPQAIAPPNDGGMSFFTRNAMMMQDPATGEFIDPQGAAKAQAAMQQDQGSLIQRMLGRLGNKA